MALLFILQADCAGAGAGGPGQKSSFECLMAVELGLPLAWLRAPVV